ncbi:hypothetical protein, partial [Rummeliibacillus suwonensis]|uniref:hypothetical protein n=1 Tax=Rummeliibacillus suwonensis TaxID=1306154 RepID=UPI0035E3CEF9
TKTGMTTVKATAKVGVHKVKDAAEKIPTLNLYPYAPQHQLAGVNASIVPYNTVNSVGLRDQLISMAKVEAGGSGKGTGEIKNVYNSIKQAPKYPSGFKAVQNGTKKVNVKNQDVLEKLREVESGQWKKIYKDGYDSNGEKISIHYFEGQSGKVFDVKVKSGWSNK